MKCSTRSRLKILFPFAFVILGACAAPETTEPPRLVERPGAEVFKLPVEAGFQDEMLELRDGRFRYWFSSDVVLKNPPKYPTEGQYRYEGDRLILSDGNVLAVRELNGVRMLWKAVAIEHWGRYHIINVYGIFLPVPGLHAAVPSLTPFFTADQWAESREAVRRLEQEKK